MIFIPSLEFGGGAEQLQHQLAVDLALREKNRVIVLTQSGHVKDKHQYIDYFSLGLRASPSLFSVLRAISDVRKKIEEYAIDVVEVSSFLGSIIAVCASKNSNAAVFLGVHQPYSSAVSLGRFTFIRRFLWKYFLSRGAVRYYAISKCVQDAWVGYAGVNIASCPVIYNSIDDVFFTSPAYKDIQVVSNTSEIRLLHVARITKDKGLPELIDAVSMLDTKGVRVHLDVAGRVEPNQNFIIDKINNTKLELSTITYHGLVDKEGILDLMHQASIFVLPTKYEGFGLAAVEALAQGMRLVVGRVGGLEEVLAGFEFNVMVDPSSPQEIADKIEEMASLTSVELGSYKMSARRLSERYTNLRRCNDFESYVCNIVYQHRVEA